MKKVLFKPEFSGFNRGVKKYKNPSIFNTKIFR